MLKTFITICIPLVLCSCGSSNKKIGETAITKWQFGKPAAISITYDDASINQFRKALPIMDTLGIKATFYINTADIPESKFPPKWIGRPLREIVTETATVPTSKDNLFERASAMRFLPIEKAVERHNTAGSLFENNKLADSYRVVDSAFEEARNKKAYEVARPVLLRGDRITWNEIKAFAANGHEFGSHTISHPRLAVLDEPNMLYELEKCKEEIRIQVGPEHIFSAECPFGTENERVMEYAYKVHAALRNRMPEPYLGELNRSSKVQPGTVDKEYVQWQRGAVTKTSLPLMKSWVDTVEAHENNWLVLVFHGVDGKGWEALPGSLLQEYFEYIKKHEDKSWIATFGDVTKYMRERMNAKVNTMMKGNNIEVDLTHSLDKSMYNLPLTLRTMVPASWTKATVKQGDKTSNVTVKNGAIVYDLDPGKGIAVISGK